MDFNELIEAVENWADEKGILEGDWLPQWRKVEEEFQELAYELTNEGLEKNIKLELGDLLVTLIILAPRLEFDITECLQMAYDKIKDRKGKTVNGTFIKQEDLEKEEKTLVFKGDYIEVYKLADGSEEAKLVKKREIENVILDKEGIKITKEGIEAALKNVAKMSARSFDVVVGEYNTMRFLGLSHEEAIKYYQKEECFEEYSTYIYFEGNRKEKTQWD